MTREQYAALKARKRAVRGIPRPWLWDLADQWGLEPGYVYGVWCHGIKRYDIEDAMGVIEVFCEAVDEARAYD